MSLSQNTSHLRRWLGAVQVVNALDPLVDLRGILMSVFDRPGTTADQGVIKFKLNLSNSIFCLRNIYLQLV